MKNEKSVQRIFLKSTFAKGFQSPWPIFFACCIVMMPVLFVACVQNDVPGVIYNPAEVINTSGKPTITSMTPASGAVGGVREITINGSNLGLKNGTDTNWIFIGGVRPFIKEIHDSYVTIFRPRLSNDHYDKTISVSVTDPTLLTESSNFTYSVETPGVVVGDYASLVTSALVSVDFDIQENLYAAVAAKGVVKTDFAGVTQTPVLNSGNLLSGDYAAVSAMSFGPGSYQRNLFIAVGKNYIARIAVFDTLNRTGTKYAAPVKLTVPAAVIGLDFDENGNMYTVGNGNFYIADTSVGNSAAPTFTAISGYAGVTNLIKIRVVKVSGVQNIYIADSTHVWKSQLTGTTLVMGTPLVDLSAHAELSGCTLSSFDVDEFGSLFLCVRKNPKYSLFFRESDGSITPYYKDPSILPNTADRIVWGNGKYLYLISSALQSSGSFVAGRVYRLTLDRNGAPYQGRTFIKY
jgi:hypothetical protein